MDGRIRERKIPLGTFKSYVSDRGTEYTHDACERRLKSSTYGMMRWFSRSLRTLTDWNDRDMRESEVQRLRWVLDDLASYVEIVQRALDDREGVNRRDERIAKLRAVQGRTPAEAAAFLAAADRLESKPASNEDRR